MNKLPKRNRTAYIRQYFQVRKQYWQEMQDDPEFNTSWDDYRIKHLHSPEAKLHGQRGRPKAEDRSEWTKRQQYQSTYQASRRAAAKYYNNSAKLQKDFEDFKDYWAKHKTSWLPEGFLRSKEETGHLTRKYRGGKGATDRSDYQAAYREHRRKWDHPGSKELWERFAYRWEDYWALIKTNGFVNKNNPEPPIENAVTHDSMQIEAFTRIPPGWLGRKKQAPTPASPITHAPTPIAVRLDTDPDIEDNDEWFTPIGTPEGVARSPGRQTNQ